jgi:hypothetical protein
MNLMLKKSLAGVTLSLAMAGLLAGTMAVGPALANQQQDEPEGGFPGTDATTSASTYTLPWCGWYLTGVSDSLTLNSSSSSYDGTEIALSGEDTELFAFVNGSESYSDATENCSWYGAENRKAAQVTVTANGSAFDGSADGALENGGRDLEDTSMDFTLDADNKLNIAVNEDPDGACTADGFQVNPDASMYEGVLSSTPIQSAIATEVTTTNRCAWSMEYSTKIPAGMSPKYGALTYDFTGPTLTTTLDIQ